MFYSTFSLIITFSTVSTIGRYSKRVERAYFDFIREYLESDSVRQFVVNFNVWICFSNSWYFIVSFICISLSDCLVRCWGWVGSWLHIRLHSCSCYIAFISLFLEAFPHLHYFGVFDASNIYSIRLFAELHFFLLPLLDGDCLLVRFVLMFLCDHLVPVPFHLIIPKE